MTVHLVVVHIDNQVVDLSAGQVVGDTLKALLLQVFLEVTDQFDLKYKKLKKSFENLCPNLCTVGQPSSDKVRSSPEWDTDMRPDLAGAGTGPGQGHAGGKGCRGW